jgi:hypothetical protein
VRLDDKATLEMAMRWLHCCKSCPKASQIGEPVAGLPQGMCAVLCPCCKHFAVFVYVPRTSLVASEIASENHKALRLLVKHMRTFATSPSHAATPQTKGTRTTQHILCIPDASQAEPAAAAAGAAAAAAGPTFRRMPPRRDVVSSERSVERWLLFADRHGLVWSSSPPPTSLGAVQTSGNKSCDDYIQSHVLRELQRAHSLTLPGLDQLLPQYHKAQLRNALKHLTAKGRLRNFPAQALGATCTHWSVIVPALAPAAHEHNESDGRALSSPPPSQ